MERVYLEDVVAILIGVGLLFVGGLIALLIAFAVSEVLLA